MSSEHPMPPTDVPPGQVSPGVRAQLLATEHWSLLATRGMTWSEVMSRITIHLTIASASLVVLALVVQASGFGTAFHVLSIGLASAVLVLGLLTAVRVHNASVDDALLLVGMNRLRAAYLAIDPTLEPYLVTSWHDDQPGLLASYTMGVRRSLPSHVLGSTSMFMNVVNTIVAGTLGALIAGAAGGGPTAEVATGLLLGLVHLGTVTAMAKRSFGGDPVPARFPTPPAEQ